MRWAGPLLILLALSGWTFSQDLRGLQFTEVTWEGFDHIYNLDYGEARQVFQDLALDNPDHPAPPLYLATVAWLEELLRRHELDLNRFAAPGYFDRPASQVMPHEERRSFFRSIDRSQALAEKILQAAPTHQDARYFLGLSHGILASFTMTIDRERNKAFSHGKKAYAYHRELVQEDPDYFDAYMSVGMYEYIVGSLPWYFKWLAVLAGYRGSREKGMEYLRLAVERGEYVSRDARVLQMVLLVLEKDYSEALANARFLHQKYPRNYLLHLNQAQILEWMGETEQAVTEYRRVVELAQAKQSNYQILPLGTFRHALGIKFLELNHDLLALDLFQASLGDPITPDRERALSYLRAGQIHDFYQRRQEARQHYQEVLKLEDFEGSHSQARQYLEKSYQRRD